MHHKPISNLSLKKKRKSIMKNKLFLAFAAILFAAITLFNLNLAQQEAASDITLAGVEMVAGAFGELPGQMGRYCSMGMQYTGNWNDVAVMCSNCHPLLGYRSQGSGWNCG
jgi:hypothetical protein